LTSIQEIGSFFGQDISREQAEEVFSGAFMNQECWSLNVAKAQRWKKEHDELQKYLEQELHKYIVFFEYDEVE